MLERRAEEEAVTGRFCQWREGERDGGGGGGRKIPGAEMSPAGDVAVATRRLSLPDTMQGGRASERRRRRRKSLTRSRRCETETEGLLILMQRSGGGGSS